MLNTRVEKISLLVFEKFIFGQNSPEINEKKKFLDSAPVFGITAGWVLWNSGKLFQFLHKGKNLEVVKSSGQATASLGVAGKATGGIEKKNIYI